MESIRTYKNVQEISSLKFSVPVTVFCPLGPNYYRAVVDCEMKLGDVIADFLDLERFFKKDLNGEHLTTEDLVAKVFDVMSATYHPEHIRVSVHSDSHFSIETIKES